MKSLVVLAALQVAISVVPIVGYQWAASAVQYKDVTPKTETVTVVDFNY